MEPRNQDVRYLLFDVESVADPLLVASVRHPGEEIDPIEAIEIYRKELMEKKGSDFIPYTYQFPVSVVLAKQVAELARLGDPIAREVGKITADHLGRALALAANLINPARIVIGGGVSGAFDLLEPELNAKFRREVMTGANRDVQILQTALGYEAGIYGAASLFFTS